MLRNKIQIVVAYCRLSREDGDNESVSIANQKKIIEAFAKEHNMIISDFYIDDGVSGYIMDRPDFDRLKMDLNTGKVDVVIVKDLSRLGRHNAKVQLFLENILETGKRIIAIGDGYDTLNGDSHNVAGIQTWMNEIYVRDVSKKVRTAIDIMQKEGRYISCVPYGYYIDPFKKGVYHIDETCAMYVREMFDMYLNGMSANSIAKSFKLRGVPTGTMILKQRLERMGKPYRGKASSIWSPNVILSMLKNDFYIGTLTLGKTKRRSINGKKIKQPEENQYVFEDAHEAIIDKRTFKQVQEMIVERGATNYRGKRVQTRPNIFTGILYCASCGTRLTSVGNNKNTRYVCRTYNLYGTSLCTSHSITESELTEALIYFLEHCRENLGEAINDLDKIIKNSSKKSNANVIDMLENDVRKIEHEIKILLEQKMRDTIKNPTMVEVIDGTYSEMITEKYSQINSLKVQLDDCRKESLQGNTVHQDLNSAMAILNDIIQTKQITKRQIGTIVKKIIVHEDGGLDIFLKGNLHELCTNYLQMKSLDKDKILQEIIGYIEQHPDRTSQTKAWKYARAQGCRIGFENFSKVFSILINLKYVEANEGYNKGYRLIKSIQVLKDDFRNNIVTEDTVRVTKNSVTIRIINKICEWIRDIEQTKKKNVF